MTKVTSLVLLISLVNSCCGFSSLIPKNPNHSNHIVSPASLPYKIITCSHEGNDKCPFQNLITSSYYHSNEEKDISKEKNGTKNQNDITFLISNYVVTQPSVLPKKVSLPTKVIYFGNHQNFSVYQLPRAHLG